MNVEQIRTGIKSALSDVVRCSDFIPEKPEPPVLIVAPDDPFITYQDAMAQGLCTLHFDLVLLVQRGDDRAAQKALDAFLSSGTGENQSIIDALMGNRTLGIAGVSLLVQQVNDYGGRVEIGENTYGQAVIKCQINTPRT